MVRDHAEQAAEEVRRRLTAQLRGRISVDDLMSAGTFGLLDAVGNFNPADGNPFGEFAGPRIREAIVDEIRSLDWLPLSFFTKWARRADDPPEFKS